MTLLTLREAAAFLGYHKDSLGRLLREGELQIPHRRMGTGKRPRYRFILEQLEEWIAEGNAFVDVRIGRVTAQRKPLKKERANA